MVEQGLVVVVPQPATVGASFGVKEVRAFPKGLGGAAGGNATSNAAIRVGVIIMTSAPLQSSLPWAEAPVL